MTANIDYHQIEYEIANILQTIEKQQIYINELSFKPTRVAYQYDAYVKGQKLILNRLIKKKIELENKLQRVHEERYNEFKKIKALSGINDVMNIAFQYAHPTDKDTNKYIVEKRVIDEINHFDIINSNNNNDLKYKKDRFELFLEVIITTLKILRFICIIFFVIIKFVYIFAYIYIKLYGAIYI